MILQSLCSLYDRLLQDDEYNLPRQGYSVQNITFRFVLNQDGSLHKIEDARKTITNTNKHGKKSNKLVARQILAPDLGGRSRNIKAYFLCDKLSYFTGYDSNPKREKLAKEQFKASKELHLGAKDLIQDDRYDAVCRFFESFDFSNHKQQIEEAAKFASTGVGAFRVLPELDYIHNLESVRKFWATNGENIRYADEKTESGQCLITGEVGTIAKIHEPQINGFGKDTPLLVSFNDSAYQSYGKEQSLNSPVSQLAVFKYCNALNALTYGPKSQNHRVIIGETTTVFWTERNSNFESIFSKLLNGDLETNSNDNTNSIQITDQDIVQHKMIQAFLSLLRTGGGAHLRDIDCAPDSHFFILGISKVTKSRLAVRFWHVSTTAEITEKLREHYLALALLRSKNAHPYHEPEFPTAIRLLDQSARERKAISPILGGQLMQAILQGTRYPMTLYQGVLNRIRVVEKDQNGKSKERVTYLRAAVIKAVLIRNFNQTIEMSLNTERTEPAYLLGRLFAALEKTQQDALGNINAGIRERFYSSASATPGIVFPRILRTYTHHLSKLKGGLKVNRERLVQSIHAPLDCYPTHLDLEDQGLFAIGYYHQRQALFTKNDTDETPEA